MSLGKQIFKEGDPLERKINDWAQKTATKLKRQIAKNNLMVTQELLNSMEWDVMGGNNPGIIFSFRDYGAFRDMKMLFWTKHPPIEDITKWVKHVGLSNFDYVPGYKSQGSKALYGMDQDKAASRIAWGISKHFASGEPMSNWAGKKKKRNQWQQPILGKAVAHLSHILAESIAEEAGKQIVKPFYK